MFNFLFQTFYKVRVKEGHILMTEDIEVNTDENFVLVTTPQMGKGQSVIFHDYNTVSAFNSTQKVARKFPAI